MIFNIFCIFTANPEEMIQFDLRIFFPMGWFNHHLVSIQITIFDPNKDIQIKENLHGIGSNVYFSLPQHQITIFS